MLYKRISGVSSPDELHELQVELIDRFGLLPPPLKTLFAITALKLLAEQLGVAKIQAGAEGGSMTFAKAARVDPTRLLKLIESDRKRYRLDGPYKLKFSWTLESPEKRVAAIDKLLKRLGAEETAAAAA
jgi:transcription-repair coupling factor (superfamily II helicase)